MSVTRRKFMQALTVAGGAGVAGSSSGLLAEPRPDKHTGRKKRTLYFNDARHYYLYVFEPPMTMEDAWVPIDEVAGTAVDTFVYGVERGGTVSSIPPGLASVSAPTCVPSRSPPTGAPGRTCRA